MNLIQKRLGVRLGHWLRSGLVLALLGMSGPLLAQNINDVPMAVKNNVAPNLMFMIDNSGSMRHVVPSAPYDPSADYTPSGCTGTNILGNGSIINARIITGGVPRFCSGTCGTEYRHYSLATTGTDRRCFAATTTYQARLITDTSSYPRDTYGTSYSVYTGNYLNWYFGNAGGHPATGWVDRKLLSATAIAAGQTVDKRIEVARRAAKSVVDSLPTSMSGGTAAAVRVGLATYDATTSASGGDLVSAVRDYVSPASTNTSTAIGATAFKAAIDTLTEGGETPLASTLADLGRYLATGYNGNITLPSGSTVNIDTFLKMDGTDQSARNACLRSGGSRTSCTSTTAAQPIQQWCQRSYAFLMTDGIPNGDRVYNNNTYLRDYDKDCQGALASNCVSSGAASAYDKKLDRVYDTNGSDYLDDVAKALYDIDWRPDLAAPAGRTKKNNISTYVIGFADDQVKNSKLLAAAATEGGGLFKTADDENSLKLAFGQVLKDAFAKDAAAAAVAVANAQITLNNIGYASSYNSGSWYGDLVAYSLDTTTALQTGSDLWSLRTNLDAQSPSTRKIATYNGATGVAFAAGLTYSGKPAALTDGVINFLRGVRTGEGSTYRQRQSVLGDIINAEPVVVTYSGNVPIVFQAANDGMLHVVDGRTDASVSTRGQELWAYVPKLLHASLDQLSSTSYQHRYYIDGTPATAEVTGLSFTRLLVGGLGKGGRGYYALNISDYSAASEAAAASKVLWEFTSSNMGYSFGTPLIVKTAAGWRVVVTSGYDNGSASGGDGRGYVWVLDPSNGSVLATMTTGVGSSASPSGLAHLSKLANTAPDALVRYVWGGDLQGNVWRFDLDTSTVTKIASLTDAGGSLNQPITSPPEVGPISASSTKFMVMVGTGRYLADEDVPGTGANAWATQRQSVYGLVDDTSVGTPTLPNLRGSNGSTCPSGGGNGDLVCQTLTYQSASNSYSASTNAVSTTSRRGWYVDLPTDSNLTNGRVVGKPSLTTGGTLALTVNVPTNAACDPGGRSWFLAINASTGGAVPRTVGGNTYYDAGTFLGYALASRTVIVTTADGKRALIRMSDKTVKAPPVPESASAGVGWRRVYWRLVDH